MAGAWYLLLATTKNETPIIATPSWVFRIKFGGNDGDFSMRKAGPGYC